MTARPLAPAAQYLRMSTDLQDCSLDNQAAVIASYAEQHDFVIIKTYEDAGKSGLTIRERTGLMELLDDVLGGRATYRAILVYDVSRWGRFQDVDEAAHYEFLCKREGIRVHYVAEQFGDPDTMPGLILKALKRTMAAEFSRELGEKVSAGKRRLAAMGFHEGGAAGYGLRRVMLSADGRMKQVLRPGEHKSLTTDRVILALGPTHEVNWVRWIYAQALKGFRPEDMVRELNVRRVPWQEGKPWNIFAVREVLTNPKYAGVSLWARTSSRLHTKARPNPSDKWIVKHGAFPAIVDEHTFDRTQKALRNRTYYKSNAMIISELKRLLKTRGFISESMIDHCPSVPSVNSLRRRFGSMVEVYRLIGFRPPSVYTFRESLAHASDDLRRRTISEIQRTYPGDATPMKEDGRLREVLVLRGMGPVSILMCRSHTEPSGLRYWTLNTRPSERGFPTLICLLAASNAYVEAYHVVPNIDAVSKLKLTANDPWFRRGIRLASLADLRPAVEEVLHWVPLGWISRRSGAVAQLMGGPGQRTHAHDLERAAIPVQESQSASRRRTAAERDPTLVREAVRNDRGQRIDWRTPMPKPLSKLGTAGEPRAHTQAKRMRHNR